MWFCQGSILGPLLSRIFVNDLSNSAKVVDLVFFAEDTDPFCAGNNIRALFETTYQELSQSNGWFLQINIRCFINLQIKKIPLSNCLYYNWMVSSLKDKII